MEPLDLSTRPPRSGLEKLGGLYLLARAIDKGSLHETECIPLTEYFRFREVTPNSRDEIRKTASYLDAHPRA